MKTMLRFAIITMLRLHKYYIYIVIHRQTVSLYHNSSVWLAEAAIETRLIQTPIQDSTTLPQEN